MREIVLYPGESITIGDMTVKCEMRGGQFIGSPQEIEKQIQDALKRNEPINHPPAPQQIPSIPHPSWPQGPWTNPSDPYWPGKVWCGSGVSGLTASEIAQNGRGSSLPAQQNFDRSRCVVSASPEPKDLGSNSTEPDPSGCRGN